MYADPLSTVYIYVYVHAKRALKRFFVKCAYLVLFDSLFHTTDGHRSDYLCTRGLCLSHSMQRYNGEQA